MSQVLYIFTIGLSGVFLCMALLYGSMRFTAMVVDTLLNKKEEK